MKIIKKNIDVYIVNNGKFTQNQFDSIKKILIYNKKYIYWYMWYKVPINKDIKVKKNDLLLSCTIINKIYIYKIFKYIYSKLPFKIKIKYYL